MLNLWLIVIASVTLCFVYILSLLVYRISFHPLVHLPGPWLAKATYSYEWYYDLYLPGQFTFKLKELHKRYGTLLTHARSEWK